MKTATGFFVVALILCGCQATSGPTGGESGQEGALDNPAIAASIALDLSGDLAPFLPQGSTFVFQPDRSQALASALNETLVRQGYRMEAGGEESGKAVLLQVWSTEVEGDLLVRLSTPSHRLSKVYRQGASAQGGDPAPAALGSVLPAGPLLVETIHGGASS